MDDGLPTFLGLPEDGEAAPDVVVLPLPYELTTSYGQGTAAHGTPTGLGLMTLPTLTSQK